MDNLGLIKQFLILYMPVYVIVFIKLCVLFYSLNMKWAINGRTQHNCMIDYVGN